ncbi:recombinase family protein (plasmid) [Escherichia coli]|uniref:recombinase family protein n=1 Tax=Escherichia coli TaxID=562 RepID=UPI00351D55A3
MRRTKPVAAPMVARVYLRVSTDAQDLERQEAITTAAKAAGYYVAGIYREKASGARADRPELLRMIGDLQPGEVVIAEKIDRISRLPLPEAERLVASIQAKGASLAVPGVVDLSDLAAEAQGVAKIVLEAVQIMLFRLALQMARDDYEDRRERQRQGIELARQAGRYKGRRADPKRRAQVVALRKSGYSINKGTVAKLAMRQPFVLFKGLTFQKLCLPGAFRPGDHHNKMLRPGLCVVHASPQYL